LSELENSDYGFFLKDAPKRSTYLKNFSFFETTPEIDFLFEKIDCFALTSRLDTMASVAIEAMASAKPVITFQGTGGIPDLITDFGFKEQCVAEYLNVTEFAEKIQKLESDSHFKSEVGAALRNLALRTFDSNLYASKILAICDEATKQFKN
jgi:glycosyltransferase involved in cell wall biosynthesis